MNNTETVTLSLSRFKELEAIEKAFNEKLFIYRGRYGYYEVVTESDALKKISLEIGCIRDDIAELKNRNIIERILNK